MAGLLIFRSLEPKLAYFGQDSKTRL